MTAYSRILHDGLSVVRPEFLRQLRWRLWLAGACLALDLTFRFVGGGTTSTSVLLGYVPYLLFMLALMIAVRRGVAAATSARGLERIMLAAFTADFLFVASQMHLSGGGWWHGASFFVLTIMIAATTVTTRTLALVTTMAVAIYIAKGWLEISGRLPPPLWGDFPRVDQNMSFFWNYVGFGVLVLTGTALLQAQLMWRIRHMQQRHRAVLDASPYLVLSLDATGVITAASGIAHRVTGRHVEQLVGEPLSALVDAREHAALAQYLTRARRGEQLHAELRGAEPQNAEPQNAEPQNAEPGNAEPASDTAQWFTAGFARVERGNTIDSVVVTMRDMTDERARRQDNARLASALEESRRLEMVGRLVSGVAHELNNPLAAILALTEQMERETGSGDLAEESRVIHQQARRARSIVRDLLQVARAPAPAQLVTVNLAEVVAHTLDVVQRREECAGVTIRLDAADDSFAVQSEEGSLEQVVTNLVMNAVQATPTGGTVTVALGGDALTVVLVVRDTGPGFGADVGDRLFEPFFTTRPPGQGTGLGLAVSRAIVERLGGTISASAGPTGARFEVSLPRALATDIMPVPRAVTRTPLTAPPEQRRSVLLVDDEPAIRLALRRWFERQGWTVLESNSGVNALERLLDQRADVQLVVCDLKMPDMDGMAVYAALEAERPEMLQRLIIATGDVASADVAAFLADVRVPVLEKPFTLQQLADTTREIEQQADTGSAATAATTYPAAR